MRRLMQTAQDAARLPAAEEPRPPSCRGTATVPRPDLAPRRTRASARAPPASRPRCRATGASGAPRRALIKLRAWGPSLRAPPVAKNFFFVPPCEPRDGTEPGHETGNAWTTMRRPNPHKAEKPQQMRQSAGNSRKEPGQSRDRFGNLLGRNARHGNCQQSLMRPPAETCASIAFRVCRGLFRFAVRVARSAAVSAPARRCYAPKRGHAACVFAACATGHRAHLLFLLR
jgi:hypothetical protein